MMLTGIGKKPDGTGYVAALLDCHARIRRFSGLARRIADTSGASPEEIREAAQRVHFYFTNGLPEHVQDEEESIVPRLRGTSAEVDGALETMAADHARHEAALGRLLGILAEVSARPERLGALAAELSPLAAEVERDFLRHLELEERVIFPAIGRLPADVQAAMHREGRERRG